MYGDVSGSIRDRTRERNVEGSRQFPSLKVQSRSYPHRGEENREKKKSVKMTERQTRTQKLANSTSTFYQLNLLDDLVQPVTKTLNMTSWCVSMRLISHPLYVMQKPKLLNPYSMSPLSFQCHLHAKQQRKLNVQVTAKESSEIFNNALPCHTLMLIIYKS